MSDWLFEYRAALGTHIKAGLSASQIAGELSIRFKRLFTRNAVIGKARREKLQLQGGTNKPGPKPKKATTPAQRPDIAIRKAASAPKAPAVPFTPRPDPRPGQVPLLELAADGCRYPNGTEAPYLFCNQPALDGLPYCVNHAALCYRAPDPRRTR
jgi:GcrA cell cycle regulator